MSVKALKALRRFCLECQGGNAHYVRFCPDVQCKLYPLRLGMEPIALESGAEEMNSTDEVEKINLQGLSTKATLLISGAGPKSHTLGLRAIRTYCLVCAGGRKDVRECAAKDNCTLWSYRFGVLPLTYRRVSLRRKTRKETLLLPGFEAWQKP